MAEVIDFGKRRGSRFQGHRRLMPKDRRVARNRTRRGRLPISLLLVSVCVVGVAGAVAAKGIDIYLPRQTAAVSRHFSICGSQRRVDCVVDGDTFYMDGQKIRIADIDTPEVYSPRCTSEAALAGKATRRLHALLNAGPIELRRGIRDEDVYGRKLRTVHRNGRSLGEILVAENLAHEWHGHKLSWCG